MKTIVKNEKYQRIDNETAELRVNSQGWKYCPKKEWKEQVRDINKKIELKPLPEELVKAMKEADEAVKKKKFQKPKRS